MLDAQRSYGPDQTHASSFGPITFGRNLFALLPEDDFDRQPVAGAEGRFILVADVRLDNRLELASVLGLGVAEARRFADSEILLRALQRWGQATPEHLLGDFA